MVDALRKAVPSTVKGFMGKQTKMNFKKNGINNLIGGGMMKKIMNRTVGAAGILILLMAVTLFAADQRAINAPVGAVDVRRQAKALFAKGALPPFSFIYHDKPSSRFIKDWSYTVEKKPTSNPDMERTVYAYLDPESGLQIQCLVDCYPSFQAMEWRLRLTNTSKKNTPLIEKLAVVSHSFTAAESGAFTLHHAKGSNAERSDFQPLTDVLQPGESRYLTPNGGRSSDNTALPFFNIEFPGEQGLLVAVGWSGKWYAEVQPVNGRTISLNAGMEKMHCSLYPQESIRSPKVCLLHWQGADRMTGHNQFRRFMLAHHSRKIDGRFAEYPLSGSFDYGDPPPCGEYNCLTEEYAISLVKRYQHFRIVPELFWLDAGWYTGCGWDKKNGDWWQNVGNWTVDAERFPNGLKAVADAVHQAGAKFMVWFEPERVRPGTLIDREHSEWLLKIKGNDNYLFNLGDPAARQWLTNYLMDFIREQGIDYYRQDFNFDPMPYWLANDPPERIGISECKHIEGLYAFWDSLLETFPNLLIDNCASGGRRIDLETMSRSAPLGRTDYQYGDPNGYQCHTYGLNFYQPIHGSAIYQTDAYTFRSGLGATAVLNWEITGRTSEPIPAIQKRIAEYKTLRPYFYSDYYPLSDSRNYTRDTVWLAYQLNRPEQQDGIVLAFRREGNQQESLRVKWKGLSPEKTYRLDYSDYGLQVTRSGHELMEGMDLSIPHKPGSLLIRYRAINE